MKKNFTLRMLCVLIFIGSLTSCSISYKFNSSTLDYTKISTITIEDIPNQAALVYPPLSQFFTEKLRDHYVKRTKLEFVDQDGDLTITGSIVGYDLSPMAVQENAIASRTKFTMSVRVTFTDKSNPKNSFKDRTFSEYVDFDSSEMFNAVQDQLVEELSERIVKQIYNATVENW